MSVDVPSYNYETWTKNLAKLWWNFWKEVKGNNPEKIVEELITEIKSYLDRNIEDRELDILNLKKKELYKTLLINPSKELKVWDYNDYRNENKEIRNKLRNEFIQLIKEEYQKKWDIALSFLDPSSYDNCEIFYYYQGVGMTIEQIQNKTLSLIDSGISWIKKMLEDKDIDHYWNINKMENFMIFVHDAAQIIQDENIKNQIFIKAKEFINTYPQASNLKTENKDEDNSFSTQWWFNVSIYSVEVNGMTIQDKNNCGALLLFGLEWNWYWTFEWKPEWNIITEKFDNTELRIYTIWEKIYLYNNIDNYKEVPIEEFYNKKKTFETRTYVKDMGLSWWEEQKKREENPKK